MSKAYDRVSRVFLIMVLRRFGFSEVLIDMIWRLVSGNWYSVLVNGQTYGFFRSSRGVKQGDPYLLFYSSLLQRLCQEALIIYLVMTSLLVMDYPSGVPKSTTCHMLMTQFSLDLGTDT